MTNGRGAKYTVLIHWDWDDNIFIAEVPELPGCSAHGDSRVSALENVNQAIELWIETATEFGDTVPQPKGERLAA
jgi:predicted RNase H-like HicB family nuclease